MREMWNGWEVFLTFSFLLLFTSKSEEWVVMCESVRKLVPLRQEAQTV